MATSFPASLDSYTTKVDNVDTVLAAHMNNVQDAIVAIETKVGTGASGPFTRAYNNAAISIANNTTTAITLNSEQYDTHGFHNTSSLTSRLTVSLAGVYQAHGHVVWAANATGYRRVAIVKNGTTNVAAATTMPLTGGGETTEQSIGTTYYLANGDYLELYVNQTSGGALNVTSAAEYSPYFTIALIRI